jgi:hypothetical protein
MEAVNAGCTDIHSGARPDSFKPFQNLYVLRRIIFCHTPLTIYGLHKKVKKRYTPVLDLKQVGILITKK